jgi:hypothetical protein
MLSEYQDELKSGSSSNAGYVGMLRQLKNQALGHSSVISTVYSALYWQVAVNPLIFWSTVPANWLLAEGLMERRVRQIHLATGYQLPRPTRMAVDGSPLGPMTTKQSFNALVSITFPSQAGAGGHTNATVIPDIPYFTRVFNSIDQFSIIRTWAAFFFHCHSRSEKHALANGLVTGANLHIQMLRDIIVHGMVEAGLSVMMYNCLLKALDVQSGESAAAQTMTSYGMFSGIFPDNRIYEPVFVRTNDLGRDPQYDHNYDFTSRQFVTTSYRVLLDALFNAQYGILPLRYGIMYNHAVFPEFRYTDTAPLPRQIAVMSAYPVAARVRPHSYNMRYSYGIFFRAYQPGVVFPDADRRVAMNPRDRNSWRGWRYFTVQSAEDFKLQWDALVDQPPTFLYRRGYRLKDTEWRLMFDIVELMHGGIVFPDQHYYTTFVPVLHSTIDGNRSYDKRVVVGLYTGNIADTQYSIFQFPAWSSQTNRFGIDIPPGIKPLLPLDPPAPPFAVENIRYATNANYPHNSILPELFPLIAPANNNDPNRTQTPTGMRPLADVFPRALRCIEGVSYVDPLKTTFCVTRRNI